MINVSGIRYFFFKNLIWSLISSVKIIPMVSESASARTAFLRPYQILKVISITYIPRHYLRLKGKSQEDMWYTLRRLRGRRSLELMVQWKGRKDVFAHPTFNFYGDTCKLENITVNKLAQNFLLVLTSPGYFKDQKVNMTISSWDKMRIHKRKRLPVVDE